MSDKPNGNHRPIGRDGDWVTRGEVNARILGVDTRSAGIAANVEQLQVAALRDISGVDDRAQERDAQLERSLATLKESLAVRIDALEARTLSGRIRTLRQWWNAKLESWREPFDAFPSETEDPESAAAQAPVRIPPAIAQLLESAMEELEPQSSAVHRRILWTGDPDCLPPDLRIGFHQGGVTRIDKALPIRNESGEAGEVLCYVGDFITVDANGDLGVEPACEKCHQPSAGPGLAFEDGTICNEPAHVGSMDPHPPKPRLVPHHVPGPMSPPPPPKDRDFA